MPRKPSYEELEKRVKQLEIEAVKRKKVEEGLQKRTHELGERVKKLNCLYVISKLVEKPDISLNEILRSVVDLIPPSWQYPEITCSRLILEGQEFRTKNFRDTIWKQTCDIIVHGERIGTLDVCYLEERPEGDEGPFFKEERSLLNAIAERLGRITERMQTEDELRVSEAQKCAILDASIDKIHYVDKDMRIIWANKTTLDLCGSLEDIVGQTCHKVLVGRDTPCEGCPTQKAKETGKIERGVIRQPKVRGIEGESYWDIYCVPLKNKDGDIKGFIQIARNITDQKRAEEHIHALAQQLLKAQEVERQMIFRELHDRVAQDISTLKIESEILFDNQPAVPREIRQRVSKFAEILQGVIMAVRDLSYELRPPSLDQLGLIKTVFQYCEDFSKKNGVSVDFYTAGMDDLSFDSDIGINLFRLIQEGLNNIKKHTDASNVTIRLVASSPNIILRIEDDGKGFDMKDRPVTALNEKRMGLQSMQERVSLLQGKMTVKSRPMGGTRVVIEVPYQKYESNKNRS